MHAQLILEDGTSFSGTSFGEPASVAGEVVFNTGMVGYPECLTDPSYAGQILVLTYPLVGNYGVPDDEIIGGLSRHFESGEIHVAALVVAECSASYSHRSATRSLAAWLTSRQTPGLAGVDTRALTQKLRDSGSMLGKIVRDGQDIPWRDPNVENLVANVSRAEPATYHNGRITHRVAVLDCGCKNNLVRSLLKRGVEVTVFPWDWPLEVDEFDGVLVSNGPGDPAMCTETISTLQRLFEGDKPVFGVCLGSQLMALAAGAETYKLKYGHRGQNQPCHLVGSQRCYITSQNHGYAVDEKSLPPGWVPWFFNANDGTIEGIRHESKPFGGVQFHPEATPGPVDTAFLFDTFLEQL